MIFLVHFTKHLRQGDATRITKDVFVKSLKRQTFSFTTRRNFLPSLPSPPPILSSPKIGKVVITLYRTIFSEVFHPSLIVRFSMRFFPRKNYIKFLTFTASFLKAPRRFSLLRKGNNKDLFKLCFDN